MTSDDRWRTNLHEQLSGLGLNSGVFYFVSLLFRPSVLCVASDQMLKRTCARML